MCARYISCAFVQIAELNTRCDALTAQKAAQAAALGEKDQQLQQLSRQNHDLSTTVRCCQVFRPHFCGVAAVPASCSCCVSGVFVFFQLSAVQQQLEVQKTTSERQVCWSPDTRISNLASRWPSP
jgi:hypothetical protein